MNVEQIKNKLYCYSVERYSFTGIESYKMNKSEKIQKLGQAFTPGKPVTLQALFCGRQQQLSKIVSTIVDEGCHAILYGERGVGKTSLANVAKIFIEQSFPIICYKVSCDPTDTFGDIWRKIFRKINLTQSKEEIGFVGKSQIQITSLDNYINKQDDLKPSDVIETLRSLPNCLLIFDEFENANNTEVREKFSYTIKALSDEHPKITLLMVGIAENIHGLIHDHKSVERCLKQIHLPGMDDKELKTIIDKGLDLLDLRITDKAKENIVRFSQGFPYYTHLLGKYIAQTAIEVNEEYINESLFHVAVDSAIEDAHESTRNSYESAIRINKATSVTFEEIVMSCALASESCHDGFKVSDLQKELNKIIGKKHKQESYRYYINELCTPARGNILRKVGTSNRFRYKFSSPLVKAFVYLKMYQLGKLPQ